MKKVVILIGSLVLLAAVGGYFYMKRGNNGEAKFRWTKVDRGDVTATVTATGTLSAVTTVNVGSQVSGIIAKLLVDFNSQVKKGQLLAELDPTPFQQTVDQQKANLEKAKVELRNSEISLTRAKNLFKQDLEAQSDLDAAQTARDSAAASVAQTEAALQSAETNLSYTKITSPIDGVVATRAYDIGQTVAASFQAPVLFTIAQDLTKMQVLTNIDESDVGRIRDGQVASFTVDAFPDTTFKASVTQIRLSPQTVQNVVTYPVMLDVPNPDLKLMPGMTANVLVPVDSRPAALRVPNAALRFRADAADLWVDPAKRTAKSAAAPEKEAGTKPDAEAPKTASAAGARPQSPGAPRTSGPGMAGRGGPGGAAARPGMSRTGTVYVDVPGTKGKLRAVTVRTLLTDGNLTAVESADLKEGDEIVVGLATARAGMPGGSPAGARRPF
ncbi:MAG: efflux RND transporter periplasmic adaptor subunit [Thermoanaerobaculia bacterium]